MQQGGNRRVAAVSTWILGAGIALLPGAVWAQIGSTGAGSVKTLPTPVQISPQQVQAQSYQGSVSDDHMVAGVLSLTLEDAVQRGLQHNLGVILTANNQLSARSTQLAQLQSLLPTISASIKQSEMETDLQAQGLRISGFPAIIGPYAYQDFRASLDWTLFSVASLRNYIASKHGFAAAGLSVEDARNEVVLSVGNAYLLVIADQGKVESAKAQVNTSKVSFDQAHQQHEAGT